MKKIIFFSLMGFVLMGTSPARASVNVFACEPEWGALAKEIGGDAVSVTTATTAQQDPHHIRAKPSLLAAIRKADLLICSGGGLEAGWLPVLLQQAGGQNVQPGAPGYLMASDHVTMMDKPKAVDRSMGDVHPEGNPHVHLDPHNVLAVGKVFAATLEAVDGTNAKIYREGFVAWSARWQANITRWQKQAAGLRGKAVITHHDNFAYLNHWLGLKLVGTLEPKPGVPPTASHLEALLASLNQQPASLIIRTPYEDGDASEWLAGRTGIKAVALPYTIGGNEAATDLTGLFDSTLNQLLEGSR